MKILNKKAFSVVEYVILFVIIISAFLVLRNYLQRGIYGSWGRTGQSFAFGRQFDSQRTVECTFDPATGLWYDQNCYASQMLNAGCNVGDLCEPGIRASCENVAGAYCSTQALQS